MSEEKKGLIYGFSAFALWGFLVVFFKQFNDVDPYEIVAHRLIWSAIVLFFVLLWMKRLEKAKKILFDFRISFWLFLSGFLLALSWCIFVYAVDMNMVLQASLGNFISPLISILLGFIVLREKISIGAKISIGIVFAAIALQVFAVGSLPILSILLALIVSAYGLIRKKVKVPALEGLFVENLLILPIGLIYIFYVIASGENHFLADLNGFLLFLCGPVTIVPLLFFTAGTTRINLSLMGYLQYINPTISMILAVFVYGEKVEFYKLISFCLIWTALLIISLQGIYTYKRKTR
ncbi:MAG: EamA family transporter RarD [Campylobacter sp.]|nr:EamA family transporter RarD [Campylobacter sp.]